MPHSTNKVFRDYVITIVIALTFALLVRNYVIEAYRIPSFAMKPTLIAGDTVFISKWAFQIQKEQPKRGDVVVFSTTPTLASKQTPTPDYIRRVIGLPGDEIKILKGDLFLNGQKLATVAQSGEPCMAEVLPEGKRFQVCKGIPLIENFGPEKVPGDSVFVIGDLRTALDVKKQKGWGMIPLASIKGKALWIWLSIDPNPNPQEDKGWSWLPQFRFGRMFQRIQ